MASFVVQANSENIAMLTELAETKLLVIASETIIVQAVKEENNHNKLLKQIKKRDALWKATPGLDKDMQAMLDSKCSQHLIAIKEANDIYAEIFVMDNQGANTCMTDKTSDYWQGDEAKFQKSFAQGKGGIHIGKVKFDDSTQAYLVQISIPVNDGKKIIGAMTFGIDIEELD